MQLRLSEAADADSRAIYRYGAMRFGIDVADRYAAKLGRALTLIADHPRIARIRDELNGAVRAYPVGSHVIVYEILDDGINVIRIRHSAEDWIGDPV